MLNEAELRSAIADEVKTVDAKNTRRRAACCSVAASPP